MTSHLTSAESGCLLLADITGYTAYLQGSELEHAQDVLADLLETIIAGIEPPFVVSKLEGDAVFAYISTDDVGAPMLFDTIESTYFAFRRRLRDVVHGTTCDCNACILIPSLDLKFFIHRGEYVVRHIGRTEELTGSDVVLVHRLLKGSAREVVGNDAFAVLTESTIDSLEIDTDAVGLVAHTEKLDVGATLVFIENLEELWKAEEARIHRFVSPDEATDSFGGFLPGTPQELWHWFTDPRKRLEWQEGLTGLDEFVDGRRGVGTVNHCAHGAAVTVQEILDWQPFSTYTSRDKIPDSPVVLTTTTVFTAVEGGTNVTAYTLCEPEQAWPEVKAILIPALARNAERLATLLSDPGATV